MICNILLLALLYVYLKFLKYTLFYKIHVYLLPDNSKVRIQIHENEWQNWIQPAKNPRVQILPPNMNIATIIYM